jgi:hypothetical protein
MQVDPPATTAVGPAVVAPTAMVRLNPSLSPSLVSIGGACVHMHSGSLTRAHPPPGGGRGAAAGCGGGC